MTSVVWTLDEEKNGYVAKDQLLYALEWRAGLMPGVTDLASAWGHMGTRTNLIGDWVTQGSRIIYITGELGYDGPLYDRLLAMTDDMLGPSPIHINYMYWTMHRTDSVCRNSATTDQYHGTHDAIYYVISIVYDGQTSF